MRFFFAVMVIFSHSFILTKGDNSTEQFWLGSNGQLTGGYLAVAFFFIVSGFLITQSWMNSSGIFSFFRKRILRIYPAFIVASLVCVLFISALGSTQPAKIFSNFSIVHFGINSFFRYLPAADGIFVNNPVPNAINGSAWTIKYEFWCYIIIALLGMCGILRRRNIVLGIFCVFLLIYGLQSAAYIDLSSLPDQGKIGLIFGSWVYYPEFLSLFLGGTVFYLFRDRIPFSLTVFSISIVILLGLSRFTFGLLPAIPVFATYILLYLGYHPKIRLNSFARRGDFSYGLYIWAYPIQQLLVFYFLPILTPWVLFLFAFVITLILAMLSWYLIEKPAINLKNKHILAIPVKHVQFNE